MPHAVYNLGNQNTSVDLLGRPLVPGVEPGGSRAGRDLKPALLIRDAWIEVIGQSTIGATGDELATYNLKLSQEVDLTPGLLLPVAQVRMSGNATNNEDVDVDDIFRAQGTIWAPRVVGVRLVEFGSVNLDVDVHLDYERIDVPWMDWLLMWEFLDGIVDNEREY